MTTAADTADDAGGLPADIGFARRPHYAFNAD